MTQPASDLQSHGEATAQAEVAAMESPAEAKVDKALNVALITVNMIVSGYPSSKGFVKLGPSMRKSSKSTRQSTLIEIGLSRSRAPSLNPPPSVTSGLRPIPIAR